jgi:hypothetical protein
MPWDLGLLSPDHSPAGCSKIQAKAVEMIAMPRQNLDPFENPDIKHLQLFLYLIPVVGFFPALWTLYRRRGNRQERTLSRLVVTLAFGWLFGSVLLGSAANASETAALPLLLTSSLLTSGYFLVNIWLMVRLWQRKSLRLPGFSNLGDRLP